jgi:hypothetical protein
MAVSSSNPGRTAYDFRMKLQAGCPFALMAFAIILSHESQSRIEGSSDLNLVGLHSSPGHAKKESIDVTFQ